MSVTTDTIKKKQNKDKPQKKRGQKVQSTLTITEVGSSVNRPAERHRMIGGVTKQMAQLFVEVYRLTKVEAEVPVPSAICLFFLHYLQNPPAVQLTLVISEPRDPSLIVQVRGLNYQSVSVESLQSPVSDCYLPVFANDDSTSCVAGLCAVLRQVVKHSAEEWRSLLGFREGCLFACAEVSLWTKFCEIDIVEVVNNILTNKHISEDVIEVSVHLARFEEHLKQPVRMHNVDKLRKQINQDLVKHDFAEGHSMSLADLIIVPCMQLFLQTLNSTSLAEGLPSVFQWYQLVISQEHVKEALKIVKVPSQVTQHRADFVVPTVPKHSLYKSDPKRYKPKSKVFTRQDEVETALKEVEKLSLQLTYDQVPFGHEIPLEWESVPEAVQPDVPLNRLVRKRQQLENLTKAVIKVAQPGDTIVDFCCGSGHLGIVLAHHLPQCRIILLDNKEESLARAKSRVIALQLLNTITVQCNLDYFKGDFQVGVSLHACGVASDLVMHSCLQRNAAFVICPCCYGSLQNTHVVTYPRSEALSSKLSLRNYLVLSHCADQTHTQLYEKSDQGEQCMAIVDYDRCRLARDQGYIVSLAKLVPVSASPKNNLLVGIPRWHIHALCELLLN